MTFILLVLVITLVWAAVTGTFTLANLLLGAAIAGAAMLLIRDRIERPHFLRRLRLALSLALLFLYELALSAGRVALLVMAPDLRKRLAPGIFAYPLTVTSDAEITLLANLITLTPGTLSVDVSEDRRTLYVHALELRDKDEAIAAIRNGFEARIIAVFSQ